jgi:hypothetical protein
MYTESPLFCVCVYEIYQMSVMDMKVLDQGPAKLGQPREEAEFLGVYLTLSGVS